MTIGTYFNNTADSRKVLQFSPNPGTGFVSPAMNGTALPIFPDLMTYRTLFWPTGGCDFTHDYPPFYYRK
jgi:hypothetical protein